MKNYTSFSNISLSIILLLCLFIFSSCAKEKIQQPISTVTEQSQQTKNFTNNINIMKIQSKDFSQGETIPQQYTCRGANLIPTLEILNVPETAQSLALILDDPDAPRGTWTHWIVFNIDPETKIISQGNIPSANFAKNDSGNIEYSGPCPPSGQHRYFFKLFALDTKLDLQDNVLRSELEKAMQGHIVEQAELMGVVGK